MIKNKNSKSNKKNKKWLLLLTVGIVLVIAGIIQGDYLDVLRKAAMICLECVGIG